MPLYRTTPYSDLQMPVLALGGSLDPVAPSADHLRAIRSLLADAPTTAIRVKELSGLHHLLQPTVTGMPDEYASIDPTLDDGVLHIIADWISAPRTTSQSMK